jgi:hypothetical protein
MSHLTPPPDRLGEGLYRKVRAGFVAQGRSLRSWCIANRVARQNAQKALVGLWRGPKADALVARLLLEAGVRETHH